MINRAKAKATNSLIARVNLQGCLSCLILLIFAKMFAAITTPKAIVFKRLYKPKLVSNNGLRMIIPPFMAPYSQLLAEQMHFAKVIFVKK